jgi:hypothetical protein
MFIFEQSVFHYEAKPLSYFQYISQPLITYKQSNGDDGFTLFFDLPNLRRVEIPC